MDNISNPRVGGLSNGNIKFILTDDDKKDKIN